MCHEIRFSNDFLDVTKAQATTEKVDKLDFIKLKIFCSLKTLSLVKRQLTEWENIFANYIPDNGLISNIYKELL